jgi:hypothetical protein
MFLPLVEADVDIDTDLNLVTWSLIAAGVALVLLGAAPYVSATPNATRALHMAAAVLGLVVVVLALIRLF